jgi:hypothetical protein
MRPALPFREREYTDVLATRFVVDASHGTGFALFRWRERRDRRQTAAAC